MVHLRDKVVLQLNLVILCLAAHDLVLSGLELEPDATIIANSLAVHTADSLVMVFLIFAMRFQSIAIGC